MASATRRLSAPPNHFRYERKFTTCRPYNAVISLIKGNLAQFREIYRERQVNNIYFDDLDFGNYFANDAGIQDRMKTRIRWYGDLLGYLDHPSLEIKVKRGWAGEKPVFPLVPFTLGSSFASLEAQAIFRRSHLPGWIRRRILSESPILINRYARRYFLSADGHCRLTIDRDLRFYPCPFLGPSVPRPYEPRETLIIELKYSCAGDLGIDAFSNDFGLRITKFSKYVGGVDLLYK